MGVVQAGEIRGLNALLAAPCYIGLHTAQPTSGNEITGGAYARQAFGAFTITGADPSEASNDNIISFPTATADWGDITHIALWNASTVGAMLAWQPLVAEKFVGIDDVFRFLAGKLKVQLN